MYTNCYVNQLQNFYFHPFKQHITPFTYGIAIKDALNLKNCFFKCECKLTTYKRGYIVNRFSSKEAGGFWWDTC